jgi:carotenoid cleavage dioxygenase-like enzyme
MKNVANTGVLHWGGRLLALWENGLPYELNPWTLDTLGETRLGGQLTSKVLGAHYRVVTQADGSK